MPFDAFISYSHHDNNAHGNWIHQFHDKLAELYRAKTGHKLTVFLDREGLNAGDVLSNRLQVALNESAIFIPVLSPVYLSSPWCRREFLYFLEQAGERIIVGGSSRILPLQLMPFERFDPDAAAAPEVGRITGFLSEQEILYANFFQNLLPIKPGKSAFDHEVVKLIDSIFDLLKAQREQERPGPAAGDGPAIFLGYTARDSKTLRDGLLREFQQQRKYNKIAHRILPDEAPGAPLDPKSLTAAELETFLRRQLEASDFSIHLFDDLGGPKTADTGEPIAQLQYRLAREVAEANPDFRVFTAQSKTDECGAGQEEFLRQVDAAAHSNGQVEILPAFEVKAIKDYLLDKIKHREEQAAQQATVPAGAALRRVFFIHDHRDKDDPLCSRLDDLIYEQQFEVYVPVFREDEPRIDPDAAFRNFWLVSNSAVILLRNASSAWCNAMKVELIKTATEKQTPYKMAICVTEPDVVRRIREVRSHEFQIIDCAKEGYEQQLIQFLNAPQHA